MFVSEDKVNQLKYSQSTMRFMDEYHSYEKKLILERSFKQDFQGSMNSLINYLQDYRISFSLFLGAVGFLLLTNHLNTIITVVVLYSFYHYVRKLIRKKERVKELELNKVRRSIFFNDVFLKNKDKVLEDLCKGNDDLGLFSYYKQKNIKNNLTERDMESIVSLLKVEVKKQQEIESKNLTNFVRKISD